MTDTPVLHVDMDAFYASVATRDRPELRDVPVIVGGGHRGVVLSANYLAREHGVRSGMPSARARRLCPQAVTVSPEHDVFGTVSAAVVETFRRITPVVEVVSIDEAFLDVRGSVRRWGTPEEIADRIRATVHDEQGITCSVGVAASISVAKLASRLAKPDGVVVVPPEEVTTFLHPLDVGELYGVGEKTRAMLHRLGLVTVGDVAHTPLRTLQRAVGQALGSHLHELAWGLDRREVVAKQTPVFGIGGGADPEKSMGAQQTFSRDVDDREVVLREMLALTGTVSRRMRVAEVSLGDYVLPGGESAALVMIEAVVRLLPDVLGNPVSHQDDSHSALVDGLLEGPSYTRPASWRGLEVPPILLSGDHARVAEWRREQRLQRTRERRPDLLD